jgi:hypothetical protein
VLFWVKALKLPIPQRNYRFCPTRKYEIDWAWPDLKIGIEIQGGIWSKGAHARPLNILRDMSKRNLLTEYHWRVWEFTPAEAIDGEVIHRLIPYFEQGVKR